MDAYRRLMMHAPFGLSARIRQTAELNCPLTFPDATMPFMGYEVCRFLPEGHHDRNTLKDMVAIGSFIATALVVQHVDRPITSKSEALETYRDLRVGPWDELLTGLVDVVRGRWHWRIPEREDDREYLRVLCQGLLSFENEFYDVYADFLRRERAASRPDTDEQLRKRLASFHHPNVDRTG